MLCQHACALLLAPPLQGQETRIVQGDLAPHFDPREGLPLFTARGMNQPGTVGLPKPILECLKVIIFSIYVLVFEGFQYGASIRDMLKINSFRLFHSFHGAPGIQTEEWLV